MKNFWFTALFLLALAAGLVGCGRGLSGKYAGALYGTEIMSADFQGGDKVFVSSMGGTTLGSYKVDGDHVIIDANGQNMVLTLADDGSLTGGPMGVVLKKKE